MTPPDFLDESPQKIKLSPILEMLADDNAEKEGTVKGEGNEGQNMNVEEKNGVTAENACTENDKCENKTEVHSYRDGNQSPVKEENESEGLITTGIHDVLVGGADGDVIDAYEEEDR